VPIVQLSSKFAPWLFFGGLVLDIDLIAWAGVILFAGQTIFTLITLPVEFDASRRARQLLINHGVLRSDAQIDGITKVLKAASLTYVAGAVSAIGTLLYFALLAFSRSRSPR
jgi:Zn-dependent membrane protease YugP